MIKKLLTLKINEFNPERVLIQKAAKACRQDKLIVFPTETVYAIGGRMQAPGIEKRLREMTRRPGTESFIYYIGDWAMLDRLKVKKTPLVCAVARQFWPGAVTLIVADFAGKKMGIRFPRNKIALAVIHETGEPLLAAGANRSGKASPHTAKQAAENLSGEFDCLIEGDKTEFRLSSTIVDLTGAIPVVIRQGAQFSEVEKAILRIQSEKCPRKRILIVCTGNVCRSPMAEGFIKREIAQSGLLGSIEVISCGIQAHDGLPCTSETQTVMLKRGIDLIKFRSRLCRGGDLWSADLVFVMKSQHAAAIAKMLPAVKNRTITLDVEDPIGLGMEIYEKTFLDIEMKLKQYRDEILRLYEKKELS